MFSCLDTINNGQRKKMNWSSIYDTLHLITQTYSGKQTYSHLCHQKRSDSTCLEIKSYCWKLLKEEWRVKRQYGEERDYCIYAEWPCIISKVSGSKRAAEDPQGWRATNRSGM